ncbi:hypothetical protein F511_31697 [Dorcoceras hygrometricum]|uniref:Uncharacterized protein n=1 Tax=Dorcoceras hygrometricum TaxID=472368 RepID=A0A2Z7B2D4_9LAMI|nr:hypothetical protein F511_31697 [Dorcoceras hygrometricum]
MRAIKDRIARPASQLAIISIEPLYHAQQVSRWKSSVRDLQDPSAHHCSVVFRHDKSVGHHSDDSVGLFRNNKSVGQSQRGSQSCQKSINQAQYTLQKHGNTNSANQLAPDILNHGRSCLEPQIQKLKPAEEPTNSLYEDTETSHFFFNIDSGLQMGSNKKSNSERIQPHQNHSNHRRRTAEIDENRSR